MGPKAGLDRCGKSRPPPGFDPRTVQPVVLNLKPNAHGERHSCSCHQNPMARPWEQRNCNFKAFAAVWIVCLSIRVVELRHWVLVSLSDETTIPYRNVGNQ